MWLLASTLSDARFITFCFHCFLSYFLCATFAFLDTVCLRGENVVKILTSFVKHRHVFRRNLELSDECVKKCKVDIIHNNNSLISTKTPLLLYFFCDA